MENPSYWRRAPLVVTEKMRREIAGAVAEIDLGQMEIFRRMTPAVLAYELKKELATRQLS